MIGPAGPLPGSEPIGACMGTCDHDRCNREPVTCPDCEGAGYVTHNPRAGWPRDPQLDVDVTCSTCRGDGIVHPDVLDEREEEAY